MCVIYSLSKESWNKHSSDYLQQIKLDSLYNNNGAVAILMSSDKTEETLLSGSSSTVIESLDGLMSSAAEDARLFIHLRAATTVHIGLAYNHAFTDRLGTFIMHNGVIKGKEAEALHVDSFVLSSLSQMSSHAINQRLISDGQRFANCFFIDTVKRVYKVTRLVIGSLYTDGRGNFSTNAVGPLFTPFPILADETFSLPSHVETEYIYKEKNDFIVTRTESELYFYHKSLGETRLEHVTIPPWMDEEELDAWVEKWLDILSDEVSGDKGGSLE